MILFELNKRRCGHDVSCSNNDHQICSNNNARYRNHADVQPRSDEPEHEKAVLNLKRRWRDHGRVTGTQLRGLEMQAAMHKQKDLRKEATWVKHDDVLDFLDITHGLSQRQQDQLLKYIKRADYFDKKMPGCKYRTMLTGWQYFVRTIIISYVRTT